MGGMALMLELLHVRCSHFQRSHATRRVPLWSVGRGGLSLPAGLLPRYLILIIYSNASSGLLYEVVSVIRCGIPYKHSTIA